MAASDYFTQIQKYYIGFYGRPADEEGLNFWAGKLDEAKGDLNKILPGFVASDEAQDRIFNDAEGNPLTAAEVIDNIYQSLFNRPADEGGKDFYLKALESGESTYATILQDIVGGAQALDKPVLDNKVELAEYVTEIFGGNYGGDDIAGIKSVLDSVTGEESSLDAGKTSLDEIVNPIPTYTLAEALAAEELAAEYTLSDAAADLGELAVADVAAAQAAAQAIIDGAANAEELALDATYTIADTLANLEAADAAVLEGVASYTLAEEAGELGELTEAQIALVEGAANAGDYTYSEVFTLANALADIEAANAAVEAYIEANTIDTDDPADGVGDGDAAEITGAFTTAAGLLDTAINATSVSGSDYENDSAAMRAALLSDANADLSEQLAAAEKTLAAKQEAVTAKAGLTEALAAYEAAQDLTAAETAAEKAADLAFKTADSTYDINGAVTDVTGGGVDTLITAYGTLIEVNSETGLLELASGVTEETNPGISAVLSAALAHNAAVVAQDAAEAAEAASLIEVGVLDTVGNDPALLTAVLGLMDETSATYADIQAFASDLQAGVSTLKSAIQSVSTTGDDAGDAAALTAVTNLVDEAETNGYIDTVTHDAIIAAFGTLSSDGAGADAGTTGAVDTTVTIAAAIKAATDELDADNLSLDFDTAVSAYTTDAAANNTAFDELVAAQEAIYNDGGTPDDAKDDSGIQFDIDQLAELLADAVAAEAVADGLESLQDAASDAAAALLEEGYQAPVTLTANVAATSGNDVYLAGSDDVSIVNFDLLGSDTLFVGTDCVFNSGDISKDGDDAVLEVFLTESGSDTIVSIETSEFGSSAATPEVVEITLTGVAVDDVTITDGMLTVA